MIREKRTKARGSNRKRLRLLQRKNENRKKKRKNKCSITLLVCPFFIPFEKGAAANPIVQAHGGEIVDRYRVDEILHGTYDHEGLVVLKLPSTEAATGWYHSPEYQDLIPNQNEALDTVFILGSAPA